MNVDLSKVDYAGIRAAARRERMHAMNQLVFLPVAHLFQRLARSEARKPAAVFHSIRGC